MAHLLAIESRVGSMSRLLPKAVADGGHRRDPSVVELAPAEAGRRVRRAADNNDYLGHVMTACPPGRDAGACAGRLLARLGRVRRILPGARRRIIPAGRTPESSKYVQYEADSGARPAGRPTPRADPPRSAGHSLTPRYRDRAAATA